MALTAKSLFLYGLEVTETNRYLDFKTSFGGSQLTATLRLGYYSLSGLMTEVQSQLKSAAPAYSWFVTADRTFSGGTQNRVSIQTSSVYLEINFATGTHASTNCALLLGFPNADQTGDVTYTGTSTAGTALVTEWWGKNYRPPELYRKNFGAVNVSASGEKESVVWALQRFIEVEYQYESQTKAYTQWSPLIDWMIQQRRFDFTPEISAPSNVYDCTLEKSSADGKGLAFNMKEMLPQFPFRFTTGAMTFRVRG